MPPSHNQTFALFSALPAELRLQIWRHCCHARVVEVRYSKELDRCLTSTPPPAVLHACHESRSEALRIYYQPGFGTKSHPTPNMYFSPQLDVLYLPRHGEMGYDEAARDFSLHVLDTAPIVRSLAIDHVRPAIRRPWETYNKFCLLQSFSNLNQAFLVLASSSSSSSPSDDTTEPAPRGPIELVDPRGDPLGVLRVMEDVQASFTYEVGPGCLEVATDCLEDGMGSLGIDTGCPEVDTEATAAPRNMHLSLVPKYKAMRSSMDSHSAAIACA